MSYSCFLFPDCDIPQDITLALSSCAWGLFNPGFQPEELYPLGRARSDQSSRVFKLGTVLSIRVMYSQGDRHTTQSHTGIGTMLCAEKPVYRDTSFIGQRNIKGTQTHTTGTKTRIIMRTSQFSLHIMFAGRGVEVLFMVTKTVRGNRSSRRLNPVLTCNDLNQLKSNFSVYY